jgi:hypothetical protein
MEEKKKDPGKEAYNKPELKKEGQLKDMTAVPISKV